MRYDQLDLIAPAAPGGDAAFNEAEVFGSAVWLWMHSQAHRNAPLHVLQRVLLPAIKTRQFLLASESGRPIAYVGWASFDQGAEARYLANPPDQMREGDWISGDRRWILDWVAPFGHTRRIKTLLAERLFPGWMARALNHRGAETGLRIQKYRGIAVRPEEARAVLAAWQAPQGHRPTPSNHSVDSLMKDLS